MSYGRFGAQGRAFPRRSINDLRQSGTRTRTIEFQSVFRTRSHRLLAARRLAKSREYHQKNRAEQDRAFPHPFQPQILVPPSTRLALERSPLQRWRAFAPCELPLLEE